jgi:tRNA(Ile)-lysidine synthase
MAGGAEVSMTDDQDARFRRRTERAVERFMDEAGLWPTDGRLVVAVSGGPDSSALLLVLGALARRRQLSLFAAYFDHRLRGPEAARQEHEAVCLAARIAGAEVITGGGDVAALAKSERLPLEEAARRARYGFLAATAAERAVTTVAAGHTASDQAETVLMHVIRGAGLTGLAGMHPRSRWPVPGYEGLTLVRPLLRLRREETVAYCRAAGFTPVEDASNHSGLFLRNRVRSELLPLLRGYNPRIDEALVRLADSARADLEVIESLARDAVTLAPAGVAIDRERLRSMAAGLRRHAVRSALLRLLGDLQGVAERHIDAAVRLAVRRAGGGTLDLPRGVRGETTAGELLLTLRTPDVGAALPREGVPLGVPGRARLSEFEVSAGPEPVEEALASVEVDAEAAAGGLVVRGWRPGDRMQPLGLAGTKKLQDIFVDAHVPRAEKGRTPVFEAQHGIIWVGGLALSEWARPRPGRPTLVLSYRRAAERRS